jgi:hypothetical protein
MVPRLRSGREDGVDGRTTYPPGRRALLRDGDRRVGDMPRVASSVLPSLIRVVRSGAAARAPVRRPGPLRGSAQCPLGGRRPRACRRAGTSERASRRPRRRRARANDLRRRQEVSRQLERTSPTARATLSPGTATVLRAQDRAGSSTWPRCPTTCRRAAAADTRTVALRRNRGARGRGLC